MFSSITLSSSFEVASLPELRAHISSSTGSQNSPAILLFPVVSDTDIYIYIYIVTDIGGVHLAFT